MFYLETSLSPLDFCLIRLSPCSLSSYLRGCIDYNENGRIGMFNIIYLSFRLLSSLRLSSEETDRQLITMVHVTHTTLFISNLPMFGLPKGCHTYFLATTFRTETCLANPKKLVQPLPCLVDSVNLQPELFFFLLFKMSP